MIGTRAGAKTVVAGSGLQNVFDLFWEPQSLPIEFDAYPAAQDHWLPAGLHHG
jgi:hypothetical protein